MSVAKVIKFYTFEPQPSMLNNGLSDKNTLDLLKTVFPTCGLYSFIYDGDNYSIDIIETGDNFVFGTCAKESELKYTSFYQKRDKTTNVAEPYTSIDPNTQLEVYTYFYVDCFQNRMAAIQHKSITKIHDILSGFIYSYSGNLLKIFIAPERILDIKKAAKELKKACKIHLAYAPGKSKDNIRPLAQSLGDFEFESYTVEMKLAEIDTNILADKLAELSTSEKDNYTGIKLIGKNEYGLEETINFIETYYSKNTPFDITDDIVLNTNVIKDRLAISLVL